MRSGAGARKIDTFGDRTHDVAFRQDADEAVTVDHNSKRTDVLAGHPASSLRQRVGCCLTDQRFGPIDLFDTHQRIPST